VSTPGSRLDHNRFCEIEGWRAVPRKPDEVRQVIIYELELPNGRTLRTEVRRPPNDDLYGPFLWNHTLTTELEVTGKQFWECVRDQQLPDRGGVSPKPPAGALSAGMVSMLINLGIPEDRVRGMTAEDVVRALQQPAQE